MEKMRVDFFLQTAIFRCPAGHSLGGLAVARNTVPTWSIPTWTGGGQSGGTALAQGSQGSLLPRAVSGL